ncbi:MAG: hypothetical protein WCF16_11835 [Alphaproteobacteria bacterium]
MQIKPSASVLQAISTLPPHAVQGKPAVAQQAASRVTPNTAANGAKTAQARAPSRPFPPGTFLDISV